MEFQEIRMTTSSKTETKKIYLSQLINAPVELQLDVREMRNEPDIRKWMYTDHVIEPNEHLVWLNKIKNDPTQIVFVVTDEDSKHLGLVSLSHIDHIHNKASWAFYLSKDTRGGLGSALEYAIINFAFETLDIQKLNCEVLEGNDAVIKLHKKFLFQDEGFRRSNIKKNETYIGAHLLGLTKTDWLYGKEKFLNKHKATLDRFLISINWDGNNKNLTPIDAIEGARARNNLNWMSILRLAMELSPEHGRNLVTDIRDIDKEIQTLTDKLIEL